MPRKVETRIKKVGSNGWDWEYRVEFEERTGIKLPPRAAIHHFTKVQLVACQDQSYHMLLHRRTEAYRATGNPNLRKCGRCGEWKTPDSFYYTKEGYKKDICKSCNTIMMKEWRNKNKDHYNKYQRDRRQSVKEV